jgi:anti-sigma-K factor RskA
MDEIHELTAGYALDALEPDERDAYEAHLAGCERCQEELAGFSEVTGALALAVSGPEPSPALRERVLESVRAEEQNVVPLEAARRRRGWAPVLGAAAALAAVVALGLGIWGASVSGELDDTRAALEREQRAAAVLADPAARTVELDAGTGKLVVADGEGVLVVDDLGAAPSGKTYQTWVIEEGAPVSAGVFEGSAGQSVVPLDQEVPDGAVVAVTVEDAGGVDAPTTDPIVASQPV